jgi:hypothetical protein
VTFDTLSFKTKIGSIEITVTPTENPPFSVDAVVEEQDTSLVLGTRPVIRGTRESYGLLVKKMIRQQPLAMSEIIVKKGYPLRFTAIVYDIEKKPVCREEWVKTALKNILNQCEKHKVKNLSMPLLGTSHGKIGKEQSLNLLKSILLTCNPVYPEKIWLVSSSE